MRVLIVENDLLLGKQLSQIVQDFGCSECKVVTSKESFFGSFDLFQPNLVLVDIHLEKPTSGIEIAQFLSEEKSILFAFITAQSHPTIIDLAIQTNPLGYLIKPVKEAEIYGLIQLAKQKTKIEYLHFKDNYGVLQIPILEILYIKSEDNYIEIVGKNKKWVVRDTLRNTQKKLPKSDFLQTHRSYVVNKQHIERISNKELFVAGNSIPISKSHVQNIQKIIVF